MIKKCALYLLNKKNMKEEAKNKLLKVLHIIGYISMALLTLIFVVVGVNACNNTDNQQNETKALNSVYNSTFREDTLYLKNEIIYEDYSCRGYYSSEKNLEDVLSFLDYLVEKTNPNIITTISLIGFNGNTPTYITNTYNYNQINFYNEGTIYQFLLNGNIRFELTYEQLERPSYDSFSYYYNVIEGDFIVDTNTFIYLNNLNITNANGTLHDPFEFLIPPYITFLKEQNSFYYNLGFTFNNERYIAIEYDKTNLIFHGNIDLVLDKQYSLDGSQIFFSTNKNNINDNIIKFTTYGHIGFEWLNNNYLIEGNHYYTGKYYLNEQYIAQYIRLHEEVPQTGLFETHRFDLPFYSQKAFYTHIVINFSWFSNSNNVLVRVAYYNGANYDEVVLYKYYSLDTLSWEQRDTDVKKVEYYSIEFNDVLLTSNNYSLFKSYFFLERIELKSDEEDSYIGNVFVLIGDSFVSWLPIFNISILPGITIGVLIFIPLVISLVLFVVWLFKR